MSGVLPFFNFFHGERDAGTQQDYRQTATNEVAVASLADPPDLRSVLSHLIVKSDFARRRGGSWWGRWGRSN